MVIITLLVAFCSVIYELLLSEISSILLGGTFYRYIVTIGIYIFCLGLGSLYYERIKHHDSLRNLVQVEILLSLIGVTVPALPMVTQALTLSFDPAVQHQLVSGAIYMLIITVGLLSGLELPLLMDIGEKQRPGDGIKILAVDFLGTFLGILIFPLVLMRHLGLFNSSVLVGATNFAVFIYLSRRLNPRPTVAVVVTAVVMIVLVAFNLTGIHAVMDKVF
jgi:spermidine synthase